MNTLTRDLIHQADQYIDDDANHRKFSELGERFFDQFGSDKGKISTQVRNLQRITCSATRFADIEDFVKNQMGKGHKAWKALGADVLKQLSELRSRSHSEELDAGPSPADKMAFRLRLARGWVRAVVGGYLYKVALDQMEPSQ